MGFITALLIGMAYVLPPGPVTIETVRRSMLSGLPSALAVQLGAVAGDMLWAVLVLAGLGRFLQHKEVHFILGLVGAVVLVYLGLVTVRDGWRAYHMGDELQGKATLPQSHARHFGAGFGLALANPYAVVFWLAMGSSAVTASIESLSGFFVGCVAASICSALVAGQLHNARVGRLTRWIWSGCGSLLVCLGVQLGYTALVAL